jgi:TonB family protein
MKQKIKITNHIQQLSDEEIQRFMNFDDVLKKREIAVHSTNRTTILKLGIPALVTTLAIIAFFVIRHNNLQVQKPTERMEEPIEKNLVDPQGTVPVVPPADSTRSVREEVRKVEKRRRKTDIPPIAEKQSDEKLLDENLSDDKSSDATLSEADTPTAVEKIHTQAEPVNGYADLYEYFYANLVYPASALKDSIQGVQTVSFIVNTDGKVNQVEVEQSLGPEFEKESIRLVENMPAWKPATLDGKPVPSRISMPITFKIQKPKK